MKTILQVQIDTSLSHDKLVYDLLTKMPDNARKDFLISSVLFYTKSPSFLAEVKMGEYLEQLKALNSVFSEPAYLQLVEKHDRLLSQREEVLSSIRKAVEDAVSDAVGGIDLSALKGPKARKQKTDEIPDDAMSAMAEAFGT